MSPLQCVLSSLMNRNQIIQKMEKKIVPFFTFSLPSHARRNSNRDHGLQDHEQFGYHWLALDLVVGIDAQIQEEGDECIVHYFLNLLSGILRHMPELLV